MRNLNKKFIITFGGLSATAIKQKVNNVKHNYRWRYFEKLNKTEIFFPATVMLL